VAVFIRSSSGVAFGYIVAEPETCTKRDTAA